MIETLDALSRAFPYPAFLVDPSGRLHWASLEGARRFDLPDSAGAALPTPLHGPLETLLRCALTCLADPSQCPDRLLRAAGLVRPWERAVARHYRGAGRDMVLLALAPALADGGKQEPAAPAPPGATLASRPALAPPTTAIPGLSRAEATVARLAVEGFSVANISAQLGSAESTVRTHLRRVYKRLGVHGRAELAYVLLHGTPGGPKGET
ncbi:MAG: hypothetical protein IPO09_14995 [Anaeromyxobacter sp.]|nr:hypothetical protein [Anaeromyxobacter sp.]MBL0277099.1 hypothetical protein [Anaeromyxobacter sp.]